MAPTKKAIATVSSKKRRQNHHKKAVNVNSYIYKLFKQENPDHSISAETVDILNAIVMYMFDRIVTHATKLAIKSKHKTLSAKDVKMAVTLVLEGSLAQYTKGRIGEAIQNTKESIAATQ